VSDEIKSCARQTERERDRELQCHDAQQQIAALHSASVDFQFLTRDKSVYDFFMLY
jgi:hypothetical protein